MEDHELFQTVVGHRHLSPEELESVVSGTAPAALEKHCEECGRCSTDLFLLQEFHSAPRADEQADAVWIAEALAGKERLKARMINSTRERVQPRSWRWFAVPVAVAAALGAVVVGIRPRPPALAPPSEVAVMRSAALAVVGPVGDVVSPPKELKWHTPDGIWEYRVKLMEVDRNIIWSGTSRAAAIAIPSAVRAKMLPYKTLLWEVEGTGKSPGNVVKSSTQRFRVLPESKDLNP